MRYLRNYIGYFLPRNRYKLSRNSGQKLYNKKIIKQKTWLSKGNWKYKNNIHNMYTKSCLGQYFLKFYIHDLSFDTHIAKVWKKQTPPLFSICGRHFENSYSPCLRFWWIQRHRVKNGPAIWAVDRAKEMSIHTLEKFILFLTHLGKI